MIQLENYELVKADYIRPIPVEEDVTFFDMEVDETPYFHIKNGEFVILSHNCDGHHITSLVINLFRRWFPDLVREGKITLLKTPLVSVGATKREYFFNLDEYKKSSSKGNTRYLKGLGSLDLVDWEFVMRNKSIIEVGFSEDDLDYLDMAFGDSADARKKWLSQI
jgi:DNA gyrase/topoisomerase IV subunit B